MIDSLEWLLYQKGLSDIRKQIALLQSTTALKPGQTTWLLPPLLTNGPLTKNYWAESLDAYRSSPMKEIRSYHTVSREDMAHYILNWAENGARRVPQPAWVVIRDK